jgi:hypothetical protein
VGDRSGPGISISTGCHAPFLLLPAIPPLMPVGVSWRGVTWPGPLVPLDGEVFVMRSCLQLGAWPHGDEPHRWGLGNRLTSWPGPAGACPRSPGLAIPLSIDIVTIGKPVLTPLITGGQRLRSVSLGSSVAPRP